MIELTQNQNNFQERDKIPGELIQLRHIKGESVFIVDPDENKIEIRTTDDGAKIVFTKDETGRGLAIEERANGTKLYHISSDSTGLPSSHEIRPDNTEIVYFYNSFGRLQHFVELKPNGDRVSTILCEGGFIYSIEQKMIGGIIFQGWLNKNQEPKEGMVWLHVDGDVTIHGDKSVVSDLFSKFSKFLDGVQ